MTILTAVVVDAGVLPSGEDHIVLRSMSLRKGRSVEHVKGGWIELEWQQWVNPLRRSDGIVAETRRIAVTRERAQQEILSLLRKA